MVCTDHDVSRHAWPRPPALQCHMNTALHRVVYMYTTGSEDRRLAWYDLDLSAKPYKALRYHKAAVRGAAFHRGYPLFASSSDDGAIHVFHGMVYQARALANPAHLLLLAARIVRVFVARGHVDHLALSGA